MRRLLAPCWLSAAVCATGCGLSTPVTSSDTRLTVTRDFGAHQVTAEQHPRVTDSDTVLQMLRRNMTLTSSSARSVFVNGVSPGDPLGETKLTAGDVVWVDAHAPAARAKAVVGSFPEPFLHGPDGKRLPVRVECSPVDSKACADVERQMTKVGVLAARGGVAQSFTKHTLRILVGPYVQLRDDHAVRQLEAGPRTSGVYARPTADGHHIALLDPGGATVRTVGPGTGLIAATRYGDDQPVWVITGTDLSGVDQAVRILDEGDLLNRYAIVVAQQTAVGVPVVAPPN